MSNNYLLGLIASALPRLTLLFVTLVLLYKIYFKVRAKYSIRVNCWFCNDYSKVPYLESNSWTCTKCEQYNGFTKDGGYNREIIEQFDCSSRSSSSTSRNLNGSFWLGQRTQHPSNGFCDTCNEAQRLKVEKLAQFEPKRESRFDEELKAYKAELEAQFRLCGTCDRHLKSVLREKKKMVLGSKFLEYIIKGAEAIKKPNTYRLRRAKEDLWKRRLSFLITVMTLINLCCLFGSLPELSRSWFSEMFGEFLGTKLFIGSSHLVAFWRVFGTLFHGVKENDFVVKFSLFTRTIFMMLLYSLGLRLPHLVRINFLSLYSLAAPFCILASTFSYNVIDRFRITRYTLLLILWSIYTGGMIESSPGLPIQQVLMFLTSALSCLLAVTSKSGTTSSKLHDESSGNSFRKIYSDDYLSDGETATSSFLSQLDSSSLSGRSFTTTTNHCSPLPAKSPVTSSTFSLNAASPRSSIHAFDKTSPLSSSMLSLNLSTQEKTTTNSSFRSCFASSDHNNTMRPRFGNSVYNFASPVRNPFVDPKPLSNGFGGGGSPFGNQSFASLPSMRNSMSTGFQQPIGSPAPSFASAFVTTTQNTLQRPSRLLSPTRLNFKSKQSPNVMFNAMPPEPRTALGSLCPDSEDLSRASSRSSGFESQNGQQTNSRENSCCRENNNDLCPPPSSQADLSTHFQPLDGFPVNGLNRTFTLRKSSPFSPFNPSPALSVNCSSQWHSSSTRGHPISRDAFNLRRFNHDLPNFQRGDLLKKWKDGGEVLS